MAYNILKGTVEFTGDNGSLENTVDLASDQTVAGGKTFAQRITASAITLGGSSLSHPSITALNNNASHRVALFDAANPSFALSGNANLSFRYATLTSSFFSGSGIGLRSLQAQEVINKLSASQINFSNGLVASGYNLAVSSSHGISAGATGVSFNAATAGGLAITSSNGVSVDPTNALDITTSGQSLSDADVFVVHDVSRGKIVKADALDIYNYIAPKLSTPSITSYTNSGDNRIITSVNASTVNGEANLTFDGTLLNLTGESRITGSLELTGSGTTLLRLHKLNADSREIEIFSAGARQSAITLNGTEQLFIENESAKDIILRTNNQNTLRVFGQNQRVGIAKEGTSANAELDVDGAATISGSFTVSGSSTIGLNSTHVAQFDGQLSASAGVDITGSNPKLSIGDKGGQNPNDGMLFVRPSDTNNRALCLMQSKESEGNRVIFAVTGSGKVIVGGGHLGGVLSVSGSTAENLISAKSDSLTPAFEVAGNGNTTISGSLRAKQLHITTHKLSFGDTTARFVRFDANGGDTSAGANNKMIAPYLGKLIKVLFRAQSGPPVATDISFHKASNGTTNISNTATETIGENVSSVDNSVTFTFSDAASWSNAGDIIGIKINPTVDPGFVVATAVWEFDQNS